MQRLRLILVLFPLALSGCIAIAIPVVAGGAVARSAAKGRAVPRKSVAPPIARPPTPNQSEVAVATALPPPLPSDLATMRPGTLYTGTMPRPGAVDPGPAPAPAPRPAVSDWSDIGHHVAGGMSPEHGVLLARGSDAADPRWLGCKGKPPALLAAASAVVTAGAIDPAAQPWLEAMRVLEVRTVLVATSVDEARAARAVFTKAGFAVPVDGDTLILARSPGQLPAIRADVGARYCVLALVGRSPADFPNGLTPAATPPALAPLWGHGWFLLAGR